MKWDAQKNTSENAIERLPGLAAEYFRAGRKATKHRGSPAELHSFRVKTKKFRYALELFEPVYGPPLGAKLETLQQIQKLLGKVSDAYTTRALLNGDPKLRKQFHQHGKKKIKDFEDYWKETFDAKGQCKAWKKFLSVANPVHRGDNLGQSVSTPKPRKRA